MKSEHKYIDTYLLIELHCYMIKTSLTNFPFTLSKLLAASIIDMDYASTISSHIQNLNLFMFNTMLRGYSVSSFF